MIIISKAEFLKKNRQVNFYKDKEVFDQYVKALEDIGIDRFSEDLRRYIDEVVAGKGSASERFLKEKLK